VPECTWQAIQYTHGYICIPYWLHHILGDLGHRAGRCGVGECWWVGSHGCARMYVDWRVPEESVGVHTCQPGAPPRGGRVWVIIQFHKDLGPRFLGVLRPLPKSWYGPSAGELSLCLHLKEASSSNQNEAQTREFCHFLCRMSNTRYGSADVAFVALPDSPSSVGDSVCIANKLCFGR
jgi:hypothetical protein